MPLALLQLNNLRLAPESVPVQLEFAAGQIAVVLGRNNSGKTNLLRLLAGLPTIARGDILLDGESLNAVPTGRRPMGFVFQAFVNYPQWTVRRNIESPLVARGVARVQRQSRVAQIAQTLQIEELLERLPTELSGGQQQRLAIGRALASDARVLLLDEPFVNLDFRLRERLTSELGELLRETNTTALFTSSDCRDAFALGDSVVLLDQQQILQAGEPLAVYQNPSTLAAADLFSEPGVNWVSSSTGSEANSEANKGSNLEVVRPEHLVLEREQLASDCAAPLRYRVHVDAIETNGSHTFVQGGLLTSKPARTSEVWVAKLAGMPDLTPHLRDDNTLEFFVDPRNQLILADESTEVNRGAA